MAKTSVLNIRIDPKVKGEAEKLFSNFGITITDAVNMFLHKSLMEGGLPFNVQIPMPNAATVQAMQEVDDMISGKVVSEPQSVDDLFKELGN